MALLGSQVVYGLRGFRRNSRALLFTVVMPIILLLLFNSIFSGTTEFNGSAVQMVNYFTPGIIAYSIMLSGYSGLLVSVVTARERGILKRFRGTPMPTWVYLSSLVGLQMVVVGITVAALVGIAVALYGLHLGLAAVVGLVVYTLLGTATMCAIGLALTGVTTTADSASAVGPFSTVALGFISGVFIPVAIMPAWLVDVGRIFPLAHLANGLQRAFSESRATGLNGTDLAVLGAWCLVAGVVAVRTFRWAPQGR